MGKLKAKLIFNPNAGAKRKLGQTISLKDIQKLLRWYEIPFETFITKKAGDGKEIAAKAVKEKSDLVLVAGGDGTVGEAANGLVGSKVKLGIIPTGTFMNVSRLLSIPFELEKAIEIIKIGRVKKIDVGVMQVRGSERKHYFLESVGIGVEANFHKYFKQLEKGKVSAIGDLFRLIFHYHRFTAFIKSDVRNDFKIKTHLISINNSPISGAALNTAPRAKLNDHRLTVSIYRMSKFQIINYLFGSIFKKTFFHPHITTFSAKRVVVETVPETGIHADGRFFAVSPVEFSVLPKALNVICG